MPDHIKQLDGSACQSSNCWAATAAWLLDGGTRGADRLTPSQVRQQVRAFGCRPGGYGDTAHLLARHHVPYHWDLDLDPDALRHRLRGAHHRLFHLHTDYDVFHGDETALPSFDGYHSIGVAGGQVHDGDHGPEIRVMDPLQHRLVWIDLDHVVHAAVKYGREHGDGRTADVLSVRIPAHRRRQNSASGR